VSYPPNYGQQPQQGPYQQPQQSNGQRPQQYGQTQPGQYPPQYQGQPAYPQQAPVPYGQTQPPQYATGGYPAQQPIPQQQPMQVQQVGMSVTKPAWTCGEIALMVCTCGMAYPIIWMRRRGKTTITRHR